MGLVHPTERSQIEGPVKVATYLNLFELVAIAIEQDTMHEETQNQLPRTRFAKTSKWANPYITAKRNQNDHPRLNGQFEKLARRWSKEPA